MKKTTKARKPLTGLKRAASPKANIKTTVSPSKWIRIEKSYPLPNYVHEALDRLDEAGHIAYIVGGSVRDFLLGKASKDHDIATSATPDELCILFPDAITVGKAFGVLKIPLHPDQAGASGPQFLEIATFRQDLEYKDHRHPTAVLFSGPAEDASRRDFTINALFYDVKSGRILDTVGGMDDLKAGVIRAIGLPSERFKEDALRLLRAIRFSTRFGFQIEPLTFEAIRERAHLISHVSAERIRDELTLMWLGPNSAEALRMLSEVGLIQRVLPEVEAMRSIGGAFSHTLKVMELIGRDRAVKSMSLVWAALLHETGRPVQAEKHGAKNLTGHEREGAKLAGAIAERLKFSRQDIDQIVSLVEDHLKFKDAFQMRESTVQRFVRQANFEELIELHKADAIATDGNLAFYEFCKTRFEQFKTSLDQGDSKLISGQDLIQMGFSPGPKFAEILRTIEDLALERKLSSKEQALEYVVTHFVR